MTISLHQFSLACAAAGLATLAACGGGGGGGGDAVTTAAKPKIYVIGASYSSDGPKNGSSDFDVAGDSRHVNGAIGQALWVEVLASAWGAYTPVANTRTAGTDQSATNFARAGSYLLGDSTLIAGSSATAATPATDAGLICAPSADNSTGAACGNYGTTLTKYPANAYDQWLSINTALESTSPSSSDVLTIDSGGNDLIKYHRMAVRTGVASGSFIADRAAVIEKIAQAAATKGFKKILIANIGPLQKLPGVSQGTPGGSAWNGTRGGFLSSDVTNLNNALDTKITSLKTANPSVSFYVADWFAGATQVIDNAGLLGGFTRPTDGSNANESSADYPGTTSYAATANVLWWDPAFMHPSAKFHKYIADNHIAQR